MILIFEDTYFVVVVTLWSSLYIREGAQMVLSDMPIKGSVNIFAEKEMTFKFSGGLIERE